MIDMEGTITISMEEYERLVDAESTLEALICAGVDNWEGYDYAMSMLDEEEEDE